MRYFGALWGQPVKSSGIAGIFVSWLVASLVVRFFFCNEILSFLATSRYAPFDHMEKVLEYESSYQNIYDVRGSFIDVWIWDTEFARRAGKRLQRLDWIWSDVLFKELEKGDAMLLTYEEEAWVFEKSLPDWKLGIASPRHPNGTHPASFWLHKALDGTPLGDKIIRGLSIIIEGCFYWRWQSKVGRGYACLKTTDH